MKRHLRDARDTMNRRISDQKMAGVTETQGVGTVDRTGWYFTTVPAISSHNKSKIRRSFSDLVVHRNAAPYLAPLVTQSRQNSPTMSAAASVWNGERR